MQGCVSTNAVPGHGHPSVCAELVAADREDLQVGVADPADGVAAGMQDGAVKHRPLARLGLHPLALVGGEHGGGARGRGPGRGHHLQGNLVHSAITTGSTS